MSSKLHEWFPEGKIKPFILTVVISVLGATVSIIVSFWHDSRILTFTERPRLSVSEEKFENNNKYIFATQTLDGAEIKVRFRVSNNGGSSAQNVKVGAIYATGVETFSTNPQVIIVTQKKADISPVGPVNLAPQEFKTFEISFQSEVVDKRAVIDMLENIKNDKFNFPFAMEIYYEGEPEVNYKGKLGLSVTFSPSWVDWKYSTQ